MSHINKQNVKSVQGIHEDVLTEGLKIVGELLQLNGVTVTPHIFNWSGTKISNFEGVKLICGLDAQGAVSSGKFGGLGLGVDKNGQLAVIGDFYFDEQKGKAEKLRAIVEKVVGGACYLAARAMLAHAKGKNVQIQVNQVTKQLVMVAEV